MLGWIDTSEIPFREKKNNFLAKFIMRGFSHRDQEAAMCMLHDAKQVLNQWKVSYFKMRAEIEESGSYSRWEFDHGRLFERTDYMASICEDLFNVLQVCL